MNYTANTADNLAKLGRGGDSMLVHMQPREVAGLQALAMQHGGSLTINPDTGLPEAGFLGDLLGFVAPIALGAWLGPAGAGFGGGFFTGANAALKAGLAVGAGAWALTGDPMKGLGAGLGAAGGVGLGNNIANFGSTVKQVPSIAETMGVKSLGSAVDDVALGAADDVGAAVLKQTAQSQVPMLGASTVPGADIASKFGLVKGPEFGGITAIVPNLGEGMKKMFSSPGNFMDYFSQNKGDALTLGMPILAAANQPPKANFPGAGEKPVYGGPYLPQDRGVRFPSEEERRLLGSKEYSYFADTNPYPGYMPAMASGGAISGINPEPDDPGGAVNLSRTGYGMSSFDLQNPAPASNVQVVNQVPGIVDQLSEVGYAKGGIMAMEDGGFVVPSDVTSGLGNGSSSAGLGFLARTLGARPIRGSGDGMSDDIPARIGAAQKARVANEEAYVPRNQVARLGNGNIKRGADKLYAMMDRVRKDRTGTTKQGREINPNKYVPA